MGKASRRKHEARHVAPPPPVGRPRWAGADGFDYAWQMNEMYLSAATGLLGASGGLETATAMRNLAEFERSVLDRKVTTLEEVLVSKGAAREPRPPAATAMEPWFPGFSDVEKMAKEREPYARGLAALALSHREALLRSVPILFDPLASPPVEPEAIVGLRLPFSTVTCDFLTASGMSMPVVPRTDREGEWVGLVAATLEQAGDGILDVWPVISTLHATEDDSKQEARTLLYGRIRFGGPLPEPPEHLTAVEGDGYSAWGMDDSTDPAFWTKLWLVAPAYAAASALRLLEAVNVSVQEAALDRAARRRADREGREPAMEVVIRTTPRQAAGALPTSSVEWQHRWTVRGHWKHFTKGPVFNANPRKRVYDANGDPCVKAWCPPFVKGPEDKPLVLKARRADHMTPTATTTTN